MLQVLTPDEFVEAGDYLVKTCPTWSWWVHTLQAAVSSMHAAWGPCGERTSTPLSGCMADVSKVAQRLSMHAFTLLQGGW